MKFIAICTYKRCHNKQSSISEWFLRFISKMLYRIQIKGAMKADRNLHDQFQYRIEPVIFFIPVWFIHGLYDFFLPKEFAALNENLVLAGRFVALQVVNLIVFINKAKKRDAYTMPLIAKAGEPDSSLPNNNGKQILHADYDCYSIP